MILHTPLFFELCFLFVLIGIGLAALGVFTICKSYWEEFGALLLVIGVLVVVIAAMIGIIGKVNLVCQHRDEPIIYQQMIAEAHSIEQIFATTEDIINTDIYERAIDYNVKLTKIQTAFEDPKYSISFSGTVDWAVLLPIEIT